MLRLEPPEGPQAKSGFDTVLCLVMKFIVDQIILECCFVHSGHGMLDVAKEWGSRVNPGGGGGFRN
jgi:hypothetical protein